MCIERFLHNITQDSSNKRNGFNNSCTLIWTPLHQFDIWYTFNRNTTDGLPWRVVWEFMWLCLTLLTLCNILTIVTYGLIMIWLWEFYNTTSLLRKALIILVIFRSQIYCAKKTLCFRCVMYFVRLISFINIIMTPRHILLHGEIQIIMRSFFSRITILDLGQRGFSWPSVNIFPCISSCSSLGSIERAKQMVGSNPFLEK